MLPDDKIIYEKKNLIEKMPITYNLIKKYYTSGIQKNASYYFLLSLAERFMGIEYYVYLLKKINKFSSIDCDFIKNYNEVKNYFEEEAIQFNQFFFHELRRKIDNMLYYVILSIRNDDKKEQGLFGYLFGSKKITPKDIAKSYFSLDLKLRDLYPTNPSYFDRQYIFKSLNSKWYKCPNEHFYTIDEVKKYNDVLSCPHCTFGEKTFIAMKKLFGM